VLHVLASYAHFPPALTVLGAFFAVYGVMVIINDIRQGYFSGITTGVVYQIRQYKTRWLFGLISIIFCVLYVDVPVTKLCQQLHVTDIYTLFDFWCTIGESWVVVGVLLSLSLIYQLFGRANNAVICKVAYMSAIYAGLCNSVIKFIFNRQRPSIGLDPYHFFYFFRSHDTHWVDLSYAYDSMPSGHTITIFAAIIPLFLYAQKWWQKLLLLSVAIFVGVSRIYTINHWLSDVVTGAILGIAIGVVAYKTNLHRFKNA